MSRFQELLLAALAALLLLALGLAVQPPGAQPGTWTRTELATLRTLSLARLPAVPLDPSNRVSDDPAAAALGHRLFFDTRLSVNGQVACATCHQPERGFSDGLALSQGVGTTARNAPSVVGTVFSTFLFRDGRKDSQWAQALGPLENAHEHGGTRMQYARVLATFYRPEYEALFGALPDFSDTARFPAQAGPVDDPAARAAWEAMPASDQDAVTRVFANSGKALAAYERLLLPGESRFDRYVEAVGAGYTPGAEAQFSADEIVGLRLFISKGRCLACHSTPLLTDNRFHNVGTPDAGAPDEGRAPALAQVLNDAFNCRSAYSDAAPEDCLKLNLAQPDLSAQFEGAFRTPSLRDVAATAPYMHAGQQLTLADVVKHYDDAPAAQIGHSEIIPLHLSARERVQLEAFLRTLSAPPHADARWLRAP